MAEHQRKRMGEMSFRDTRRKRELESQEVPDTDWQKENEELDRDDARLKDHIALLESRFAAMEIAEDAGMISRRNAVDAYLAEQGSDANFDSSDMEHPFYLELLTNPDVFEVWSKIFREQDREFLVDRSKQQLELLQHIWKDDVAAAKKEGGLHEFSHRRKRKEAFQNMPLHPVHGSRANVDGEIKANRYLKNAKLQTGKGDSFIGGDTFVYASFAEIPHPFTGNVYVYDEAPKGHSLSMADRSRMEYGSSQYKLKEDSFENADLAMFDIHFAKIGPKSGTKGLMEVYLDNYFDYEMGKDILRTYLMIVFESPSEAREYLGSGDQVFERFYKEHSGWPYSKSIPEARVKEIHSKMRELFYTYGIAPPFLSEIRIPERAEIDA